MKHFSEEELIAFQMNESPDVPAIRRHLEECDICRSESESIAETLRVFSAERVPEASFEANWTRVRGALPVLAAEGKRSWWRGGLRWPMAAGVAFAALLLAVFLGLRPHVEHGRQPIRVNGLDVNGLAVKSKGPLTAEPADPAVAAHLDNAERLLTEVNHESGPLDPGTRAQAHDLLLKNATYVQTARTHGDVAQASVLEDLGRVLTSLEHEPEAPKSTWRVRLEMNTDGLLLDIRILRQNDERQ
jgi:hypothetical protein